MNTSFTTEIYQYQKNFTSSLHATPWFWIKGGVLMLLYVVYYVLLVFTSYGTGVDAMIFGLITAGIGFNIMHDGSHKSVSKKPLYNRLAALLLNSTAGGSEFLWYTKHVKNHHYHTNVEGKDHDIETGNALRFAPHQQWRWWHRFQLFYFIPLYALNYILWVLVFDFLRYSEITAAGTEKVRTFWITKLLYLFIFFIIPIGTQGIERALYGYLIFGLTCGLFIACVFQLAHVTSVTEFYSSVNSRDPVMHQLRTTANFGTSRLLFECLGGLNRQVEHHLFPHINHVHLHTVSNDIKRMCHKHGVIYNQYPSIVSAFTSHVRHLYEMSKKPLA